VPSLEINSCISKQETQEQLKEEIKFCIPIPQAVPAEVTKIHF
jgi:hypothetical protein